MVWFPDVRSLTMLRLKITFLAYTFAAVPLFAQQQLPDKFYLECYNGEYLVLVDRQKNIFSHKNPTLRSDKLSKLRMLLSHKEQ
jgi:hypothetical protein